MTYATRLKGTITREGKLIVKIPKGTAAGRVQVIVLYTKPNGSKRKRKSTRKLHPAYGLWKNRDDMHDSAVYASELRKRLETRADGGR
jgi:hypothetical protein